MGGLSANEAGAIELLPFGSLGVPRTENRNLRVIS